MKVDLTGLRREFTQSGLNRTDLDNSPFGQFNLWFEQAQKADIIEPSAMSLATSDNNEIGIRTVLLKYFDMYGFVFFTNYNSKKSKELQSNPNVALLFPWLVLERQVKISGYVEKISMLESLKYFSSRPKASQLGSWASQQSSSLSSRKVLLSQFELMKVKFSNGKVPLPDFWGGYRVVPLKIEFWQGRENRLHDRFIYQLNKGKWRIERLAP
ncbi:pyridoxamine 5'-phosphate oxidase [Candidatus Vesicomyidisocius calyptogenae]|uniref:Pyridoxine/pyridoxamine 5'-phosphate oxidase n=1 Tax=Vesicomyosocius okutanii subsp. Calyptogena okutanii (strain HA) TaxID=412965 RepID=PDXH_VESOH|nr:pyridoxamine 5'-phosphate oxidase [Candidatus Vesicomyosocius okutanii]A5CX08.1 RecName: Full=Pyridoxine/pyridoxamine 5'-phosphate oxidase; AltName: Full=PNP/PMP oxidase; Short=PNPOx; AltName: Full=Pyridoxal 5'-phosphate synthase [Candidatus Vesicomyosocius okutanii]BAF61523.1 pyridoxamine-phosphate oxidase [Candidatus Vesicomyosocius okutanii]